MAGRNMKAFSAALTSVVFTICSIAPPALAQEEVFCSPAGDDPRINIEDCDTVLERSDTPILERANAYNSRALIYMELGDFEQAGEDLRAAMELVPSEPGFYLNAAYMLEQQGDLDSAYTYYQLALRHETDAERKAYIQEDIDRLKAAE